MDKRIEKLKERIHQRELREQEEEVRELKKRVKKLEDNTVTLYNFMIPYVEKWLDEGDEDSCYISREKFNKFTTEVSFRLALSYACERISNHYHIRDNQRDINEPFRDVTYSI